VKRKEKVMIKAIGHLLVFCLWTPFFFCFFVTKVLIAFASK